MANLAEWKAIGRKTRGIPCSDSGIKFCGVRQDFVSCFCAMWSCFDVLCLDTAHRSPIGEMGCTCRWLTSVQSAGQLLDINTCMLKVFVENSLLDIQIHY